jgi:hypothetical protein
MQAEPTAMAIGAAVGCKLRSGITVRVRCFRWCRSSWPAGKPWAKDTRKRRPHGNCQLQRALTLAVPLPCAHRTNSLRARHAQRRFQFLIDDGLGGPYPLAHQRLERPFSWAKTPAIACPRLILHHPLPSGPELWCNSPDHDAFYFSTKFATLPIGRRRLVNVALSIGRLV